MSGSTVNSAEEEGARLSRKLNHRLLALTLVLLLIGAAGFSFAALRLFEADLRPALDRKGMLLAETMAGDIERAVSLGVPFGEMVGVTAALQALQSAHEELAYIAVTDPRRAIRHVVGADAQGLQPLLGLRGHDSTVALGQALDSMALITVDGQAVGAVHVGVRQSYARQAQAEVVYDVLVVFLVSLLVTFELLLVLVTLGVAQPLRQVASLLARVLSGDLSPVPLAAARDQVGLLLVRLQGQLNGLSQRFQAIIDRAADRGGPAWQRWRDDLAARLQGRRDAASQPARANLVVVRAPLFLFMFAEELSRSWFPLYVRQIYEPIPGIDEALIIGLPISLFMLVVAIFTPLAGGIIERFGTRRVMVIGTAPAVIGFIGAAFAVSIFDLIAWRCLSAISYAIIFIGSQGFIARNTDPANRAQGMAVFVVAVITAGLCGMSVGGILASQLGYRETFLVSAVLAVGAAAFMVGALPADPPTLVAGQPVARRRTAWADWRQLLGNPRFAALVAFAAIPTKLVLTGYLYYLVPLYLNAQGAGESLTGRVMMAYGLLIVAFGPWSARLADRLGNHGLFVALGGLLGGAGALLVGLQPAGFDPVLVVLAGVALLGLGHAMNNATQLAMVPSVAPNECARLGNATVIGLYRLLERAGTVAGTMVAASFVATMGLAAAMVALGSIILTSAVLFVLVMWLTRRATGDSAAQGSVKA